MEHRYIRTHNRELRELGFEIPKGEAGLALWVNLASINMTKLGIAEDDAESTEDVDLTEAESKAKSMYVEGQRVSVTQDNTERDEIPL